MRKKLTTWQRAVLYVLYQEYRAMAHRMRKHDRRPAVCFTRRSFEHALWFDWQHYHTIAITELVQLGWLRVDFMPNGVYGYQLTDKGKKHLGQDFRRMRENTHVFTGQNVPFA